VTQVTTALVNASASTTIIRCGLSIILAPVSGLQ
jgi:hypothetical protein